MKTAVATILVLMLFLFGCDKPEPPADRGDTVGAHLSDEQPDLQAGDRIIEIHGPDVAPESVTDRIVHSNGDTIELSDGRKLELVPPESDDGDEEDQTEP